MGWGGGQVVYKTTNYLAAMLKSTKHTCFPPSLCLFFWQPPAPPPVLISSVRSHPLRLAFLVFPLSLPFPSYRVPMSPYSVSVLQRLEELALCDGGAGERRARTHTRGNRVLRNTLSGLIDLFMIMPCIDLTGKLFTWAHPEKHINKGSGEHRKCVTKLHLGLKLR